MFDYTIDGIDPVYRAQNRWPADDADLRDKLERYRDACEQLALRLLGAVAVELGGSAASLTRHFLPRHTGFVRLNHYPVDDPLRDRADVPHLEVADLGVHHHTDAGALTVLLQDEIGGLQVFKEGHWHAVAPCSGALVINTGDMLQVWSNDRYRAAIHRVLAMEQKDRYSVPFFFNPRADTVVEPLASATAGTTARYRPVDWSEFRSLRTDGDYADYGTEVQISQYRFGQLDRS